MKSLFRSRLAVTFAAAFLAATAASAQGLSLDESLRAAALNSTRLRAAAQQAEAAEAAARDATASRLPKIDFGATYAYTNEVAGIDLPGLPPRRIELGDGNVYDFNVTARAPIYSGGILAARMRAEQAAAEAARWDLANDSLRLAWDVRRAYFGALGAEKRLETAQRSAARLARHLEELRGAREAGMASEEMMIQTEARLRQAEAGAMMADAEARTARMLLGGLMGRPGEEVVPADALDASLTDADVPAAIPRRDVLAMIARIEQLRHAVNAARGSFLPALSAQAGYHYAKPGVDAFRNEWMDYATVGVNLTWTLWDWNSRAARVAQARAGMRSLEARRDELHDAIETRVATAGENVAAARSALEKVDQRVALERRRFEMVRGRYRVGSSSESEFLDAQDDLTAAELDRSAAAVRLRLAEAEWLNALGK